MGQRSGNDLTAFASKQSMSADSATLVPISTHARSAVSNGSRLHDRVDGRSAAARRFRDLVAELTAEAGGTEGLSAAERNAIRQAAAVMLRAEQLQADIVRGVATDDDTLIRLSSEARRLLASLRKRQRKRGPSLDEYLASKAVKAGEPERAA